jgi:hypothetical protein
VNAPPAKDWQSPEFGDVLRAILDVHESIAMAQPEDASASTGSVNIWASVRTSLSARSSRC